MESSDEEGEILPQHVTNYYLEDNNGMCVPFSALPLQWHDNEFISNTQVQVFLRGVWDGGLQKIHKRIIAWRIELSYALPEISVLSKDNNWITLEKPHADLEKLFRGALITVNWLHFIKRNPNAPPESAWNQLSRTFSSFKIAPSVNDLLDQMPLIGEAASRDKDLQVSKSFLSFVQKPKAYIAFQEDVKRHEFIDIENEQDGNGGVSSEDADSSFAVCAFCDDGGEVLRCNGPCLRSFHPTISDGMGTHCKSLGYRTKDEYEAIQNFLCKNCLYEQHQCFACGKLGSSAYSLGQEVLRCFSATCGHFYHPACVAKLLHFDEKTLAAELQHNIASGEPFICPAHKCFICKQVEDKDISELQFALCRRCPRAYHRKCLPEGIIFQKDNYGNLQRAWEGLLPNRGILIYCLKHKIDKFLQTPVRDHLVFPNDPQGNEKFASVSLSSKEKIVQSKRSMISENFVTEKAAVKKLKRVENPYGISKVSDSSKQTEKRYCGQHIEPLKKPNIIDQGRKSLKDNISSLSNRSSAVGKNKLLRGNKSLKLQHKLKQQSIAGCKINNTAPGKSVRKEAATSQPAFDAEKMEKQIVALMNDAASSFNVEEFLKRQRVLTTYACSSRDVINKITIGLVEASVKAVRTALQKLENQCCIEDAKTVCEPEIVRKIFKWKRMLKVYLTPFLHGKRYTSFGRHFTQVEKLEEIVKRLHWYVQDGDTVVDFCCGSNDFSCLMKEMLEKTGKSCSFKNYDLIQAKNDFCFEQRDWMSVGLEELPNGSQLVMGLNPPFGLNASLANAFIDKALTFNPKLIVLIVPKETERLDKKAQYDLIWENDVLLSGKSFYLPGSVDVNDKQMDDWNLNPPPLYLWSRADWSATHIAIAREQGHICKEYVDFNITENNCDFTFYRDTYACGTMSNMFGDFPKYNGGPEPEVMRTTFPRMQRTENFPGHGIIEDWNFDYMSQHSLDKSNEMQYHGKIQSESLRLDKSNEMILFEDSNCIDMELSSPVVSPNICMDIQSILQDEPHDAYDTCTLMGKEMGVRNVQPSSSVQNWEFGAEYRRI